MGRPKGRTDTTPRKRRGSPKTAPVRGGRRFTERARSVKKQVKEVARDLFWNDWYIKIGLAVSGIQLGVTFAYITKSEWATAFSILSAIGKAAFIEGGVWLMNRAFSHLRAVKGHWISQGFVVLILFTLMWISMRANLRYEWEKKAEVKFPKGQCMLFKDDGVTCIKYEKININSANVDRYLSADEQSDAVQRGGLIPLLVFASIIIGRVMLASKDGFEVEEMRRLRESERGYESRDRAKRKKVERVERAEAVGLEAGEA